MRINLELNNQTKSLVKKSFFNAVVRETLNAFNLGLPKNGALSLSIALVNEEEIKKLNKTYRHKNETTDVLSFPEYKNIKMIESTMDNPPDGGLFLGELVLCYNDIKQYARKENLNLKNELTGVVAHGVLHLLGLRHGQKMFSLQRKIIKNSGPKRQ